MTGYGEDWGSWTLHTSLQTEWNEFETLCSERKDHSDFSKLCLKLLNPPVDVPVERIEEEEAEEIQRVDSAPSPWYPHATQEEPFSQPSQLSQNAEIAVFSQELQDYDVDSLLMELNEVLESQNIPLPEDLLSALSELPPQAYPKLLKRLGEDVSPDGLQTLCQLAGDNARESPQENGWLHPALICKYIILPKVTGEEECPNELCVVLEDFARTCPKIVISQILQPILSNDRIQRDVVQRVTSALAAEYHLKLVKYVVERCNTPLSASNINVLITLLEAISVDLNQIMKQLMCLLEKSADSLSSNEQFAKLLLIVVRRLPSDTVLSVRDTLANIVRQNKSFNKQLLLNALKDSK